MNIRKAIVGTVLAASLTIGGASAAFATESTPTRTPPTAACKAAAHTLHELKVLDARLRHDYAQLVKVRNALVKHGNTKAAKALDVRLAKMRKTHAAVVAKVKVEVAKVKAECAPKAA